MSAAIRSGGPPAHEPLAVTLADLFEAIGEATSDEDEMVATMLYMVESRRVRLIAPPLGG